MIHPKYSEAVCGMLYFYGTISLCDIFTISCKIGLCEPADLKQCMDIIEFNIVYRKKAHFSKNKLCHRRLNNRNIVEDMQKNFLMPFYKIFTANEYITAGAEGFDIMFTKEMGALCIMLGKISPREPEVVRSEVLHIWEEINNRSDLVRVTEECIDNLDLSSMGRDFHFLTVLAEISKLADRMPLWFYKGYSCSEIKVEDDAVI